MSMGTLAKQKRLTERMEPVAAAPRRPGDLLAGPDLRHHRPFRPVSIPSERVQLEGRVLSGRGNARPMMEAEQASFRRMTGEDLIPGSLNLILSEPLCLDTGAALSVSDGQRLLWRMSMWDLPVWAYRWPHAPLHVVEILAPVHLRTVFDLQDGDAVALSCSKEITHPLSLRQKLAHAVLWRGRERWSYQSDRYYIRTRRLSIDLGATQSQSTKSLWRAIWGV